MKNKGQKIGAILFGVFGLLVGTSSIINFPPYLSIFYQVFLANPLQWLIFNLIDPILGAKIESSGWILLPIFMGVVGAVYGYLIGWLIQYLKSKKK